MRAQICAEYGVKLFQLLLLLLKKMLCILTPFDWIAVTLSTYCILYVFSHFVYFFLFH